MILVGTYINQYLDEYTDVIMEYENITYLSPLAKNLNSGRKTIMRVVTGDAL